VHFAGLRRAIGQRWGCNFRIAEETAIRCEWPQEYNGRNTRRSEVRRCSYSLSACGAMQPSRLGLASPSWQWSQEPTFSVFSSTVLSRLEPSHRSTCTQTVTRISTARTFVLKRRTSSPIQEAVASGRGPRLRLSQLVMLYQSAIGRATPATHGSKRRFRMFRTIPPWAVYAGLEWVSRSSGTLGDAEFH